MFSLFKKKPVDVHKQMIVSIGGMHCTSCSLNIDDSLEDLEGVISSKTSYAKSTAKILYRKNEVSKSQILEIIKKAGYTASVVE